MQNIISKIKNIKLVVFDVDGVMTTAIYLIVMMAER